MKIGFTIGKFAPFHKGHEELIKVALREMDKVYVLINDTSVTNMPLEERAKCIKELYPDVNIILGKNPPDRYGMDEESIKVQTDYLKSIFQKIPVTHCYNKILDNRKGKYNERKCIRHIKGKRIY